MKSIKKRTKRKNPTKMTTTTRECLTFLVSLIQKALSKKAENSLPWVERNTGEAIKHLTTCMTRKEANDFLQKKDNRKTIFKPEVWQTYEKERDDELLHIQHVRKCMDLLQPGCQPNQHDHTKDELYFLVTVCKFSKELGLANYISNEILDSNIKFHYHKEAHHPEYEEVQGQSIEDKDIMEMAVDRLSRNLQFNKGKYNKEQWKTFEPKFLKNHKARLNIYQKYRNSLAPIVEESWRELKKEK